jgi:hypothetical protein
MTVKFCERCGAELRTGALGTFLIQEVINCPERARTTAISLCWKCGFNATEFLSAWCAKGTKKGPVRDEPVTGQRGYQQRKEPITNEAENQRRAKELEAEDRNALVTAADEIVKARAARKRDEDDR